MERRREALVAVYERRSEADLQALLRGAGLHDDEFAVGTGEADELARRAEQHEEADRSFFSPQAGVVLPGRTAKVTTAAIPIVAAVGVIAMLVFALVPFGERSVAERFLWVAIIGAAMGGTIAFIVAASMSADDPLEPGAADRGIAVTTRRSDAPIRDLLARLEPVRLDLVHPDGTVEKLLTEQDRRPGGALEETIETVRSEANKPPTERHY